MAIFTLAVPLAIPGGLIQIVYCYKFGRVAWAVQTHALSLSRARLANERPVYKRANRSRVSASVRFQLFEASQFLLEL